MFCINHTTHSESTLGHSISDSERESLKYERPELWRGLNLSSHLILCELIQGITMSEPTDALYADSKIFWATGVISVFFYSAEVCGFQV